MTDQPTGVEHFESGVQTTPLIDLRGASRTYAPASGVRVEALRDVSLRICPGELVAVVGHSGSGKTTLMNILGCLDRPTGGEYLIAGQEVDGLDADELARLRRETFGFVFQNYKLIATASARENVELPGLYSGLRPSERGARASELLSVLGIEDCAERPPAELSGDQQQGVAIARALMNGARVMLADEPTGALDSRTGDEVVGELDRLADAGRTVILITHDPRVAARARRRIELVDGRVTADTARTPTRDFSRRSLPISRPELPETPRDIIANGAEILRTAFRSLRANLLRTSLTLLGILIGVASVVALMLIGEGSRVQVMESVHAAGADLMTVRPNPNAPGAPAELTMEGVLFIRSAVSNVREVLPEMRTHLRAQWGGRDLVSPVVATASNLAEVRNWRLASGAFFAKSDGDAYRPVVVIGEGVREELFNEVDAIGQYLLVRGELFRVIGVMEEKGGFWSSELDRTLFVPLGTGSARLTGRWTLDSMTVAVADPQLSERTAQTVKTALERWHGEDTLEVTLNAALLEASAEVLGTFSLLLGSIAGISLLVGGIGIMNMLLTTVTERTREIGIRMAVGARRSDVLRQFLAEAVMVSLAGALAGLIVGTLVGNLVILYSSGDPLFTATPIALAVASALVIGLLFGYGPARRAAQMDPARALAWE